MSDYYCSSEVLDILKSLPLDRALLGLEYDLRIQGACRWHFTFRAGNNPLHGLSNSQRAFFSAAHTIASNKFEHVARRNIGPELLMAKTSVTIRVTRCPTGASIPKEGRPHKDFCYLSVPIFDSHYPLGDPFYGELAEMFGVRQRGKVHVFKPSTDEYDRWFVIAFCQLPFDWVEDERVFGCEVDRLSKEFLSPKTYSPV